MDLIKLLSDEFFKKNNRYPNPDKSFEELRAFIPIENPGLEAKFLACFNHFRDQSKKISKSNFNSVFEQLAKTFKDALYLPKFTNVDHGIYYYNFVIWANTIHAYPESRFNDEILFFSICNFLLRVNIGVSERDFALLSAFFKPKAIGDDYIIRLKRFFLESGKNKLKRVEEECLSLMYLRLYANIVIENAEVVRLKEQEEIAQGRKKVLKLIKGYHRPGNWIGLAQIDRRIGHRRLLLESEKAVYFIDNRLGDKILFKQDVISYRNWVNNYAVFEEGEVRFKPFNELILISLVAGLFLADNVVAFMRGGWPGVLINIVVDIASAYGTTETFDRYLDPKIDQWVDDHIISEGTGVFAKTAGRIAMTGSVANVMSSRGLKIIDSIKMTGRIDDVNDLPKVYAVKERSTGKKGISNRKASGTKTKNRNQTFLQMPDKHLAMEEEWILRWGDEGAAKIAEAVSKRSRKKIRDAVGLLPKEPFEAHHLIPIEALKTEMVVQKAMLEGGFEINSKINGKAIFIAEKRIKINGEVVSVPNVHLAGHKSWNEFVIEEIKNWGNKTGANYSGMQARKFLEEDLIPRLRKHLPSHPLEKLLELRRINY